MSEQVPERWSLDRLLGLFELEEFAADSFRAPNPARGPWTRVFGGQVAAQAVRAAQLTVDADRAIHSVHAYFIRPGRPGEPIDMLVERPRDGKSFTSRRVKAVQRGGSGGLPPSDAEVIFDMIASFHRAEAGPEYQVPIAEDVPAPEDAPEPEGMFGRMRSMMPFDMRELGPTEPIDGIYRSTRRAWFKTAGELPDDPALHACVLAFASDMGVVSAARVPVAGEAEWERFMGASLDHAVWFHRAIRADEWILFDLRTISSYGARGLAAGTMHARSGILGVSVAQEALIRPISAERPR
ncbi:MAG: acyl-CoA thioesterase domain-containing protein [Actinomycetota bacterium]